ncbi:SDR family oxidoreductase [Dyadobacter subterraneus]|uniref:SDR family oxidoreductase n=1 Tax=Dyadobacter subterraneus TaxID=2773304 RepID=A0ABR9WD06_9BACT|nr:SDR family oxidoreductase [Dyadobacter subterraneus]MBE9463372.1 SDR family oxidoreductase [Dyadobacter subterraneus]
MDLNGKRIVLLGGTSGLGFATAQAAAKEGAKVVVASSRGSSVDNALLQLPSDAEGYMLDLSSEKAIISFFNSIGEFDHLVYTAGEAIQLINLDDLEIDNARNYFNLRYWGAVMAVKYGSKFIKPGGSIVLTGGIASLRPGAGWSLGASICGAMEGLTRAFAVELSPIRVNAVSPGVVKTNLWTSIPEDDRESMYENIGNSLLVKRVGESDDLAKAYLFLMKEEFISGQVIVVDGGAVLV